MKRFACYVALLTMCLSTMGRDVEDVFRSMDEAWVLRENCRAELLNAYQNNGGEVENGLGGKAQILELKHEEQWMRVKCTEVSTIELKIMTWDGDSAVGYIATVCGEKCSSRIGFYSTNWEQLKWEGKIDDSSFVAEGVEEEKVREYKSWGLPVLISYGFMDGKYLICRFNTPEVMSVEQKKATEGMFRDEIKLEVRRVQLKGKKDAYTLELVTTLD